MERIELVNLNLLMKNAKFFKFCQIFLLLKKQKN